MKYDNYIKKYDSKYSNYDISQRLEDLKDVLKIQLDNVDNDYMRGMANGMLLAWYIMRAPYGADVPFVTKKED